MNTRIPPDAASQVRILDVDENQQGQRLDNYLISRLKGVPKTRIYRIIRKGEVRVNGGRAGPDYKLQRGDKVRVPPVRMTQSVGQAPSESLKKRVAESVIYEDESLLAVNKPSGLPVHGGTGVKVGLIDTLRALYPGQYLELAHRLDKGTSGCLLAAKSAAVLKSLQEALKFKQMDKQYHALVHGRWPGDLTEVCAALYKHPAQGGERLVEVDSDGKPAVTRFRALRYFNDLTLVEANPVTGRTHQIRVHARHAGHPICGDEKYSDSEARRDLRAAGIGRLCLHAVQLSFRHPVQDRMMDIHAPYDEQFSAALEIASALPARKKPA